MGGEPQAGRPASSAILRKPEPSRFIIHRLLFESATSVTRSKTTFYPSGDMLSPRALSSGREDNCVIFFVLKLYSKMLE